MERTCTLECGCQEPIPAPAYGRTIRGRGWGRGRGRVRISVPMEGQVLIATKVCDRKIPPYADVIHGDVQDGIEEDGQA